MRPPASHGTPIQHLPQLQQDLRLQDLQDTPREPRRYHLQGNLQPLQLYSNSITNTKAVQNFRGQHGKAYLFDSVVNVLQGEPAERNMTTGRHIVRDIACKQCNETVGWKYDKAFETSEKYKEGKYILEAELLCQVN